MGFLSLGGVFSCIAGVTLWGMSNNSGRDASVLRSVKKLSTLKDLDKLLDEGGKNTPVIVAVEGRVGSEQPISCEYSSLRGVILEETAEQHFLKHNDSGSWVQDSAIMLSTSKEVPWYLEDGTGRAYVLGARSGTGLELAVAGEVFEKYGPSLVRGTLDYLQGLKMLGVKRVEKVLPIGASLTVVGEAMKDDKGVLRLQRPHKGLFYVSPKSLDHLIFNLGKWGKFYSWLSVGCTVFGVYLLVSHAYRNQLQQRQRHAIRQRVLEAAAAAREAALAGGEGTNAEKAVDDEAEGKSTTGPLEDTLPDLCVVCLATPYNAVFTPCGHMCCCTSCSTSLRTCPLCRRGIDQVIKCYRH